MSALLPWHQTSWQQLLQQRHDQRLAHAYLLAGSEGCGKLQFARSLAAALLCRKTQGPLAQACGQCKSCLLWQAGNHPDLLQAEPEAKGKMIKIDQVRQIGEFVQQTASHRNSLRVIILSPAEALGTAAANALLKNLEEPPGRSLFLLISHVPGALLPTIRSRCQLLPMPQPDADAARHWLQAQLPDTPSADAAWALAPQQPLRALQLWQQGVPALSEKLEALTERLREPNADIVAMATELGGQDLRLVVQCLQQQVALGIRRQMQATQAAADARKWLDFHHRLMQVLHQIDSGANANAQLTLETLLLDWSEQLLT